MCDPFYALMLANILGPDYIVWDKLPQSALKSQARLDESFFQSHGRKDRGDPRRRETQSKVEPQFQYSSKTRKAT